MHNISGGKLGPVDVWLGYCNIIDKYDDTSDEDQQELDKKMGDLGEGHTDTLDEKMWGDEEDDEEEEGCENESGRGADQVQTMK